MGFFAYAFTDLKNNHWAVNIEHLVARQIISGYSDGTYRKIRVWRGQGLHCSLALNLEDGITLKQPASCFECKS